MDHLLEDLRDALGWHGIEAGGRRDPSESTRAAHDPPIGLCSAIIGWPPTSPGIAALKQARPGIGQQGIGWSVRVS